MRFWQTQLAVAGSQDSVPFTKRVQAYIDGVSLFHGIPWLIIILPYFPIKMPSHYVNVRVSYIILTGTLMAN